MRAKSNTKNQIKREMLFVQNIKQLLYAVRPYSTTVISTKFQCTKRMLFPMLEDIPTWTCCCLFNMIRKFHFIRYKV